MGFLCWFNKRKVGTSIPFQFTPTQVTHSHPIWPKTIKRDIIWLLLSVLDTVYEANRGYNEGAYSSTYHFTTDWTNWSKIISIWAKEEALKQRDLITTKDLVGKKELHQTSPYLQTNVQLPLHHFSCWPWYSVMVTSTACNSVIFGGRGQVRNCTRSPSLSTYSPSILDEREKKI